MNDDDRGYQVRWTFPPRVIAPLKQTIVCIAVRLDRHFNFLGRPLTAVFVSVTLPLCDPSRLCVLSWHIGRRGAGHRGRGALATRIHASRGVPRMPVRARGLFCEFHGARLVVGKTDTATRGRELRQHGCRRYAPHRGVVLVRVELLGRKGYGRLRYSYRPSVSNIQLFNIAIINKKCNSMLRFVGSVRVGSVTCVCVSF